MATALTALTDPVRPERGFFVEGEMWTGDLRGNRKKDITSHLISASVSYSWEDDVSGSLNCELDSIDVVTAIESTLIPILNVWWRDRFDVWHHVRERLGVFYFLPPDRSYTENGTVVRIEAQDGVWALSQLTTNDARTIKPGSADLGDWAATAVYGQTRLPITFPRTGKMPGKITNWTPNQRVLPIIADFYQRASFWPVKATRQGVITSVGPKRLLGNQKIARRLSTTYDDIIGEVTVEPEREGFCNQVFLSSSSSKADMTMRDGYKITNTDPMDRWSVPNLGYVVSTELSDDKDLNFDSMRNRAINILEASGTLKTRITINTLPDPRFDPFEAWELVIRQQDGNYPAASKWRVEQMTFGFTPEDAVQTTTLGKLANLADLV